MTKLSTLHRRLRSLRRQRRTVRGVTALAALAVALLWALVLVFLVDWSFETDRFQRIVLLALGGLGVAAAYYRFVRPWLGSRETETHMALLVQEQQHIDSDLVAAIQFESPQAVQWGSVRLEQAVIDHTAEISPRLNITEGLPHGPLVRRSIALAVTLAAVSAGVWQFPDHAAVFFHRLLLGSEHYPTETVIESITVNGRKIDLPAGQNTVLKLPYGEPLRLEAACSGRLPEEGRAELRSARGGVEITVPLQPAEQTPVQPTKQTPVVYAGELSRLVDSVDYQIYLGDAWTDRARLVVVPLPKIDVELEVTPPDYAAGNGSVRGKTGLRQVSVLEGSRVAVRIYSDKPLQCATVSVDALPEERQPPPMKRQLAAGRSDDDARECWVLDSSRGPLGAVHQRTAFEIQVTDTDGLELERAVRGVIRIKPDRRPRIAAGAITRYVLPEARPTINFQAADDYGLSSIVLVCRVAHPDGATAEREVEAYRLPPGDKPRQDVRDAYRLDLGQSGLKGLHLTAGDELEVTVRATDFRGWDSTEGKAKGKSAASDPLVFHVTDVQGILAAMVDADRQTARELKTMIQYQLNVGGKDR